MSPPPSTRPLSSEYKLFKSTDPSREHHQVKKRSYDTAFPEAPQPSTSNIKQRRPTSNYKSNRVKKRSHDTAFPDATQPSTSSIDSTQRSSPLIYSCNNQSQKPLSTGIPDVLHEALLKKSVGFIYPIDTAITLFAHVATVAPNCFDTILNLIRPHTLEGVLRLFQIHLERSIPDLNIFNQYADNIPDFCLDFITAIRKRIPTPGDAFGILLTCRVTKSNTQSTLDSKHLTSNALSSASFDVDKDLLYELQLFYNQTQVFECATHHVYSTVLTQHYSIQELLELIPDSCVLERGGPLDKGRNSDGQFKYLNTFQYILVQDKGVKILYKSYKELLMLLRRLEANNIKGFSDIRALFHKCGLVSYFFNFVKVVCHQLLDSEDSVHARDVFTLMKYQCRTGELLPLTRDGLAKNSERSPLEKWSFEAPKRTCAKLCTNTEEKEYPVEKSADKIFFGQQFNEGTGFKFALLPPKNPLIGVTTQNTTHAGPDCPH